MEYPKLKAKRVEHDLTQTDLASKLGMDVSTYNAKEQGKRNFTIKEVLKLLNILQCKFEDIFL